MARLTSLHSITVFSDGSFNFRLMKTVVDGGEVLFEGPHMHSVEAGADLKDSFGQLTKCLEDLGWPSPTQEDLDEMRNHAVFARSEDKAALLSSVTA